LRATRTPAVAHQRSAQRSAHTEATCTAMASLVNYDSDSSEDGDAAAADVVKLPAAKLPSLEEALAEAEGRAPSFASEFGSARADSVDYRHLSERLAERQREEDVAKESTRISAEASSTVVGSKRARPEASSEATDPTSASASGVAAGAGSLAPATAASSSAPAPKKAATGSAPAHVGEKVDFRERTKRQRLAGQSGIGEDFRTWRTDDEMALRQQFDS